MAHRKRNATNGLDVADSINVPLPPGIRNSRSEFRMEFIPILGFLHYWIGVLQVDWRVAGKRHRDHECFHGL